MLARRLITILPEMTLAEALETTRIHRVAGLTGARTAVVTTRPDSRSAVECVDNGFASSPSDIDVVDPEVVRKILSFGAWGPVHGCAAPSPGGGCDGDRAWRSHRRYSSNRPRSS
jgi:hypothetical protein